jgi:excisionase family DNA binding protein
MASTLQRQSASLFDQPELSTRLRNHAHTESLGVSAAEAAALLGVSESHFYCLHKTGRLGPLPVRMGRAVRWSRQELIDWFNSGSPPRSRWQAMRRGGLATN